MQKWLQHLKSQSTISTLAKSAEANPSRARSLAAAVLAIAIIGSLATFSFTRSATAATPAPAAAK